MAVVVAAEDVAVDDSEMATVVETSKAGTSHEAGAVVVAAVDTTGGRAGIPTMKAAVEVTRTTETEGILDVMAAVEAEEIAADTVLLAEGWRMLGRSLTSKTDMKHISKGPFSLESR